MSDSSKRKTSRRDPAAKSGKYTGAYLVQSFLDYYEATGHRVVPSSDLVPEDPTLLFTAAGMVPFKAFYSDPDSAPYPTAVSVQKCLRAGGKQSDLENVGRTLRHHTFFEMLGNFSFGDYFKKQAIDTAWDLSVNVWGIDRKRIWVSVYHEDDEAYRLWHERIGVPESRIVRLGKKDNFWGPVGDTGVCGPSSELYFDTERGLPATQDSRPGDDDERFIEYWNLVFPQFFFTTAGKYDPLPKPGIDTGMGLERLAFILQDVEDNYHTDLFLPIREAVRDSLPEVQTSDRFELALNAASDHVRALVFALAEGIYPSNEGRGYVLRRLLRRAVTKLHPFGVKRAVLAPAVDAVVAVMEGRYPELAPQAPRIKKMITAEEEHFLSTIDQGWNRLQEVLESTRKRADVTLPGRDAFVLYDTFGFPLELTVELADDAGMKVDEAGYRAEMEAQKERSRQRHRFDNEQAMSGDTDAVFVDVGDASGQTAFLGYESLSCEARVDRFRVTGEDVVEVSTDQTVFYPVGGGQIGDRGVAKFPDAEYPVVDAYRTNGEIIHVIEWPNPKDADLTAFFESHGRVQLEVDRETRLATARNHTGTHLLHKALRDVLGDHVTQAGSLVAPDRLRFDFHHFRAMSVDELDRVERMVNEAVQHDLAVTCETVPFKEAVAGGAMALFGEKYGEEVRVVSIEGFSKELCGGTHLRRTGEIGPFLITQESSVAAGVRRVEAVTGMGALGYTRGIISEQARIAEQLRVAPGEIGQRVAALSEEIEQLRKSLAGQQAKQAAGALTDALANAEDIGGVKLLAYRTTTGDLGSLRRSGDEARDRMDLGIGLLLLEGEKPILLIVASERAMQERGLRANDVAKRIGDRFGLRGGGKPHMAQLGVSGDVDLDAVVDAVKSWMVEDQ